MTYVAAEARQRLLEDIAGAIDGLTAALAAIGSAHELADDRTADRLEDDLFRPIQAATGRAKRTYAGFAERHRLTPRAFEAGPAGPPSLGVKGFVERAVDAATGADARLSALQDSMMPVEVGDPELRAGLAEVRTHLAGLRGRAQELLRGFGR